MRFSEIAGAALPPDAHRAVIAAIYPRWKGVRIYMPAAIGRRQSSPPRCAAERFACELRTAINDSGGNSDQADEILTALSGGYFWV